MAWEVTLLSILVAGLLLLLIGQVFSREQVGGSIGLVSSSSPVRQIGDSQSHAEYVVPAGRQHFTLVIHTAPGQSGQLVLQMHRSFMNEITVHQPLLGTTRTEDFFHPKRSSSGEVASYFEFPVTVPVTGTALLEISTFSNRTHALSMALVDVDAARRLERRHSMGIAARYGALVVLATLLLILHLSTGEPASRAYVWLVLTGIVTLLMVNGHFFMLSGMEWIAKAGELSMMASRTVMIAAGIRMCVHLVHGETVPARVLRWSNGLVIVLALAAISMLMRVWPVQIEGLDVLLWGVGGLVILRLAWQFPQAKVPYGRLLFAAILTVLVFVGLNELADAGRMSGLRWSVRGLQLSLTVLCGLLGASLVRRVEAYRQDAIAAQNRVQEAEQLTHVYRASSETDALTGLPNRRVLEAGMAKMMTLDMNTSPGSVLFIDLDHFKSINDCHGHAAGDLVLQEVARALRHGLRAGDLLTRFGGEEFVLLSSAHTPAEVQGMAERLRRQVENLTVTWNGEVIPLTTSIGLTVRRAGDSDPDTLLQRADAALYQAKHNGRNRVEMA